MSRRISILLLVLTPLALILLAVGAWAVDQSAHSGQVVRNVTLAGEPVGGLSKDDLTATVGDLADEFADTEVTVTSGDIEISSSASALGVSVDTDGTVETTMDVGRSDSAIQSPVNWMKSFFDPRSVEVQFDVDEDALAETVEALAGAQAQPPVEPAIVGTTEAVDLIAGEPGSGLDADDVADALAAALDQGIQESIAVEVPLAEIAPEFSDDEAQALADEANAMTEGLVTLAVDGVSKEVDAASFRPAFVSEVQDGEMTLALNDEAVSNFLALAFPELAQNPTEATFNVVADQVVYQPGADGVVCCTEDSSQRVLTALEAGETTIQLQTKVVAAAENAAWAESLGIKEKVGEFTTNYAAGESRVTNIHRIADITRGVVIEPGETWSVNDYVGPRTVEGGFVEGGAIYNGEFTTDIGGGVSQYATTLFNAAFFAGLDYGEYMSHSIYISRYPYGREATISYPGVDLELVNNTPYGILVWPTYTDSSITVTLYSTLYSPGQQTWQSQSSGCGNVTTQRTRTFVQDGHTEVDEVHAWYDCNADGG